MQALTLAVRKIGCNGLVWGPARLVPLAFGVHKLVIACVVDGDKFSIDWLTEAIEKLQEFVQSVDVVSANGI